MVQVPVAIFPAVIAFAAILAVVITPLRRWRAEQGLTLKEMADLTGVSVPMLSRVERGQRELAPLTRVRFARLLGIRVADVFRVPSGRTRGREGRQAR